MKSKIFALAFLFSICGYTAPEHGRNMAISIQGGSSLPSFAGLSYSAGLRFEYAFSRFISLIIPVEYRYFSLSGFAESSKFQNLTGGLGARFYSSQFFMHKDRNLSGLYIESHISGGYAKEYPGELNGVAQPSNKGATLAISGALGYSYAFDVGLILGANINMSAHGYALPIKQKGMVGHAYPEFSAQIGWSF
jgi:hypothetical protein